MTARTLFFERVGSTMDVIHQLAEQGGEAGTIVLAGEQLGGRGSRGRAWHSPPGGLWMSVLFRPPSIGGVEVISLRVGLAIARSLEPVVSAPVCLKWPNDLMLGDRKVGGILCEARWQGAALGWVAVGVGLNLRNQVPAELRALAVSLREYRPDIREEDVLEPIVAALRTIDLQAERLSPTELDQFATRSWLSGREIREPLSGTVSGLGDDGTLRVRTVEGAQVSLRNGSIELAQSPRTR
jgi:BirA family transcriptional regulator, biotin operon repressor / biotin---[acetyl-CoA-carboxylase] ligase